MADTGLDSKGDCLRIKLFRPSGATDTATVFLAGMFRNFELFRGGTIWEILPNMAGILFYKFLILLFSPYRLTLLPQFSYVGIG